MKRMQILLPVLFISVSFVYSGSLRGTVRDALSLNPVAGVNVTVHVVIPDSVPFPTTTDQNGAYSITGIIPGNKIYAVVTHKDGYIMSYARIDDLGSLDLTYDVYITTESIIPPGGEDSSTVFGSIMTPSTDNKSLIPIANAQVRLNSGSQYFDAITNSEGKYTTNIPTGLYSITVTADGYNNLIVTGVRVEPVGATVNAVLQKTAVGIFEEQSQPKRFALLDAYPNPFNPKTSFEFQVSSSEFVSIRVYDVSGREITTLVNEVRAPGVYRVSWDASALPSGVYLYRMQAGGFSSTKKMIVAR